MLFIIEDESYNGENEEDNNKYMLDVGESPAISQSLIISPSNHLQSTETPTLLSDACLQTNTKVGTTYAVNDKDDSPLQSSLPSLSPKREQTMSSLISTLILYTGLLENLSRYCK